VADIPLTASLRDEYESLFATCDIRDGVAAAVERLVDRIAASEARYAAVTEALGQPPWPVIAVLHAMECGLDFSAHLHNGDPLSARTTHVPKGRPPDGEPPFTWEASASDALRFEGWTRWTDDSVAGTLYRIERYNGFGYRLHHPDVLSPYLWAGSVHYTRGKYVADGTWSPTAVSRQIGAAVLLRRMAERGLARFDGAAPDDVPRVGYAPRSVSEPAMALQRWLNTHPGIYLKVDGKAGRLTSDAFHAVTGHYLDGDPRG